MDLLKRAYARIKRATRRLWVPSRCWAPSQEEMERIAEHYRLRVEIVPSIMIKKLSLFPIGVKAEGYASCKKGLIQVMEDDHKVFWHELGHVLASKKLKGWKPGSLDILSYFLLLLITAVILSILGYWSPFWILWVTLILSTCYMANELSATWIGLRLSYYWEEKITRET